VNGPLQVDLLSRPFSLSPSTAFENSVRCKYSMTKWDQDRISPSLQRILVSVYSSVDIIACIGLLCILILGARTKRLRSNLVLLNFEFVFFFTALGQTLLIWTGYPYARNPPRHLCVVSGAYIGAAATFKAGAAFGLIGKVRPINLLYELCEQAKALRYS
jgi:hypothetical protein